MRRRHPLGYEVDPATGLVYGLRGRPIGSHEGNGYLQVDARSRGLGYHQAHRIVWEACIGPIPEGFEINHRSGVKDDNRLSNLELVTRQGNILHAFATGLKSNAGEKHPGHKLTEADVLAIRRTQASGQPSHVVAARYGVSGRCVRDVWNRRTWAHLPEVVIA